jgi:hypothetical protein
MPALLIIKKLDSPVPAASGRWLRGEVVAVFETTAPRGSGEEVAAGSFVHFEVTDKTVAEMNQYLETYNRDIQFTLINPGPPRRYEANNTYANSAGVGHWTQETVDNIKQRWEEDHPSANITTIDFPNAGPNGLGNIWDFSGEFAAGEGQEFIDIVTEEGYATMDKRKIWYITEAGMQNIEAAGGSQSGTAQQLGGILRDARLD